MKEANAADAVVQSGEAVSGAGLKPWIPFIVAASVAAVLAALVLMALHVVPAPGFLSGPVEGFRAGLAGFERFFMGLFT